MRILLGLDHLVGGHIDLDSMFFPIYEGPVATSWRHTSRHDGPAGERSWRPSMRGIDGWKFDKRCWQIVGADVARRCGRSDKRPLF